ncbi:MAG: hypothetical protein ACYC0C_14485 [Devosia sp.]
MAIRTLEKPFMRRLATALAATLLALGAAPAFAQSIEAIDAADAAVFAAWEQTPLSFRNTQFVTEATTFGIYTPKADSTFKQGESLLVYAEPVGYGFKDNGDGTYAFGVNIDLSVKDASGAVVAEQANFAEAILASRARNREFIVSITLELSGAPAGDYVLEYTAHDIASDESGVISLPFTIAE